MALVLKDRVLENSTSSGTGSFTLSGAQTGFQSFSAIGNGNTTYYTIQGKNSDGTLTGEWEVGVGTYNAGVLSRDTVLESSNGGSLVAFAVGLKDVFVDLPAEEVITTAGTGLSISGNTIVNTAPDQTVVLTGAGTTTISGTYPTFTITSTGGSGGGDVSGPSSATANNFASFNGVTGKIIKDSGYSSSSFAPAGTYVTSVGATSPVTSTGGTTPTIAMPAATTSVSGYLTSTDWNTFNNKSNTTGTVTSVSGTGTVSGISLSGTVTSSGSLTLGGTLDLSSPPVIGGTTPNTITGTTINANTKFVAPDYYAQSILGGNLRTSGGTSLLNWDGGGSSNVTINGGLLANPANKNVSLAPTGTGTVTINPATAGTFNNMVIGGTTPLAITGTTITATTFSGSGSGLTSIPNSALVNSAITINGTSTSLGGSISVGTVTSVTGTAPVVSSGGTTPAISMPAATTSVSGYLTSTDWNTFNGKGSGTVTSVAGTGTVNGITLTGTVTSSGSLTLGGTLSGIGNSQLTNSSVTFNGVAVALGASGTITANTTNALTIGTGLSGTSFNGSGAVTIAIDSTVATLSGTQTLTNKRVTPRVSTTTSSATPTINTDNVDMYGLTAQAANITSFTTNLSGTPTDGQKLWIYIVGTAARTIAWGASFEASTVALPTTTVTTNRLDVGFVWNAATSKWRCVASA